MKTSILQTSATSESAHQLVPHEALISSQTNLKLAPFGSGHAFQQIGKLFHPDLHEQDPEKRKTYELLDGKSDDRIMDSRIIFED